MSAINKDSEALALLARFEEGVSADPTQNMSPEDAAEWERQNEKHRDKFKTAELAALDMAITEASIPEVALARDTAALEEMGRLASIDRSANEQIGRTIIEQMGGMRAMRMIGASQIILLKDGVGVKWPNKSPSKGNYFEVHLTPADEYNLEFYNVSVRGKKLVKAFNGVLWEDLGRLFEQQTGWYLRMASEQFAVLASSDEDADELLARFEEGVSADPTQNMSPEDAAEWERQNEAHKDKFKTATRANYLLSISHDGTAMVDGYVDEVLFSMIYARVRGYRFNQVRPVNFRVVAVMGKRMSFLDALEDMVQFNSGSQQYDMQPRGRNTWLVRNVDIAQNLLDKMTDEEEAEANLRDFGPRSAAFEEGRRTPDGWAPGEVRHDDDEEESDGGSEIPDEQGQQKRAGFDTIQLVALVKHDALLAASEPLGNPYSKGFWTGPEKGVDSTELEGATVVGLYDVPLNIAEKLNDVGTRVSRLTPQMAFKLAKPFLVNPRGVKIAASRMPWDYNAEDHAFGKGRWKNRQASAKEAASGLYGQTKEVWEVSWSKSRGEVTAVHKTHGPERWDTKVHEKYVIPMSEAEYNRTVADIKRKHGRSGPMVEKAAYEVFVKMKGAKKVATTKEAASGLYGHTRKVQADCEACVRKLQREASKIARTAYNKNPKVAEFLGTHARRSESLSAQILVSALSELGPKISLPTNRTARLEELRYQRQAASPQGKAQEALMADMKDWPKGHSETLGDIAKGSAFRGIHFAKILSAAEALAKKGLVTFDGVKITKKASGRDASRMTELLWSGLGKLYGWRIYRQPWDGELFILNATSKGGWQATDPKDAPVQVAQKFKELLTGKNAAKGIPVSGRPPVEQAIYWTGTTLKALQAGNPSSAQQHILKALRVSQDPSLKAKVSPLLKKALTVVGGFDPRAADEPVERAYRILKQMRLASKEAGHNYGLYGFHDKVASLGLKACSDVRAAAGRLTADLHNRRSANYEKIMAYLDEHCKTADCKYSRLLAASYPEASKTAAGRSQVQAWLDIAD